MVADIQRSLLPQVSAHDTHLELAAYYRTSRWAGGDYYDFLPLPDGRWGILIADVSGHGTPAAVMMAITHSLAHSLPGPARTRRPRFWGMSTGSFRIATRLPTRCSSRRSTASTTRAHRTLTYSSAGHNPPRLKRCGDGSVNSLEEVGGPPLGLFDELEYEQTTLALQPGDILAFYTDGITEAMDAKNVQFGSATARSGLASLRARCDARSSARQSRPSICSPAATLPRMTAPCWLPGYHDIQMRVARSDGTRPEPNLGGRERSKGRCYSCLWS